MIRVVTEVPRSNTRGDDWSRGGEVEATLMDAGGRVLMEDRSPIEPGSFIAEIVLAPGVPLAAGEYALRLRARGAGVVSPGADDLRVTIPEPPNGSGVVMLRRGPSTGHREALTADARFRRAERIILEIPAGTQAALTAQLLDRTGQPLAVPVATASRQDAAGVTWHCVEVVLAPLAQGDYLVEWMAGEGRRLSAFRVVP